MTRRKKEQPRQSDLPTQFHQLFEMMAGGSEKAFMARIAWAQLTEKERDRAEAMLTFKKAAFDRAVELGPTVWPSSWDFVKERFHWSPVEPNAMVDAALSYAGSVSAMGRTLMRMAPKYTLLVSHRAMRHTQSDLDKIILHELVHIGYSGHDERFRAVCSAVGGIVSGSGVTEPGVHIEKKIGARYKVVHSIKETGTAGERAARHWIFTEQREMEARGEPRTSWRLSFG